MTAILHDPDLRNILIASIAALAIAGIALGKLLKGLSTGWTCIDCGTPLPEWGMVRCQPCDEAVEVYGECFRAPESGFATEKQRNA